ncbi:MAG: hypothetical protein ACJATA_001213 [Sphingobacteriales bacterium]|jgi:hypothetical protein
MKYDVTILTEQRYYNPKEIDEYISNVLMEDQLLQNALENEGLNVTRKPWDHPNFDWAQTKSVIFRTTWDYFERFPEFSKWLTKISELTKLINSEKIIRWNIDKHYLIDLKNQGVNIIPSYFIEIGDCNKLKHHVENTGWNDLILKPAISGTARHTYRFSASETNQIESVFNDLIRNESMILQPFITSIKTMGEVSHVLINGKHSHSVLKRAKEGDFRVQDDFGGTLHSYEPSKIEIDFAENAVTKCIEMPLYCRVDVVWDNNENLAISELEMIEPELWLRRETKAPKLLAKAVKDLL